MQTKIYKDVKILKNKKLLNEIAGIILSGGLVALPTETVYGLAANAFDEAAVKKIFEVKGREQDNPLIVHICDIEQIKILAKTIPENAKKLIEAFFPGPLTLVLLKNENVNNTVTCELDTLAVRMPENELFRAVISAAKTPLAAPSANISGSVSPTSAAHVLSDLGGKIEAIVDGGTCKIGLESTVLSVIGKTPVLLRPGYITPAQIEEVIGEIRISPAVCGENVNEDVVSPGMKYRHYSPNADVCIIKGTDEQYRNYVLTNADKDTVALCFDEDIEFFIKNKINAISYGSDLNPADQAANLFASLRKADEKDAKIIYARHPKPRGIGLAVYNRLLRAAEFKVVEI